MSISRAVLRKSNLKGKGRRTEDGKHLFIPQTAQEKTQIAIVVEVVDDENIKVKVGQTVLHEKYAGTQIRNNGEDYTHRQFR